MNKYTKIEEINSYYNIKTILAKIDLMIKVITSKDIYEYDSIKENLENLKNVNGIHEIIEKNNKIYIVIENNQEAISEIDKLILEKQDILSERGNQEFETIPNIGKTISLMQGQIKNIQSTSEVFNGQIIDKGLTFIQDTSSLPEPATNILNENIFTGLDSQNIDTPEQLPFLIYLKIIHHLFQPQ